VTVENIEDDINKLRESKQEKKKKKNNKQTNYYDNKRDAY